MSIPSHSEAIQATPQNPPYSALCPPPSRSLVSYTVQPPSTFPLQIELLSRFCLSSPAVQAPQHGLTQASGINGHKAFAGCVSDPLKYKRLQGHAGEILERDLRSFGGRVVGNL